jgi:hypothetical protein
MRLRNWKETKEPTIIETLEDVHPRTLEEPFHWYAKVRLILSGSTISHVHPSAFAIAVRFSCVGQDH